MSLLAFLLSIVASLLAAFLFELRRLFSSKGLSSSVLLKKINKAISAMSLVSLSRNSFHACARITYQVTKSVIREVFTMHGYVYYSKDDFNWDLQKRGPFYEEYAEALFRSEEQRNALVFESQKEQRLGKFGYRFAILWLEPGTVPKLKLQIRTSDLAKQGKMK